MRRSKRKSIICILSFAAYCLWMLSHTAHAAVTKVGNGDNGRDLEGSIELKESEKEGSNILSAKKTALDLVKSLNIPGVPGLGALLPELENSKLYLTKQDSEAVESTDPGAFHADMKGRVYARTFAEPNSATRFFPISQKLDTDQLVALHIHEALHRALPPSVRENESIVSALTLSITTPGASFDSVNRVAKKWIPEEDRNPTEKVATLSPSEDSAENETRAHYPIPDHARVKRPSEFSYSYRSFRDPKKASSFPVKNMHIIRSDLYAFGTDRNPLGIGIEASLIDRPTGTQMGSLDLSGKMRLWSSRGFDVGGWAMGSLNTLSNEELKNSQYGRDTLTAGLSLKKDLSFFSIENLLGYTLPGQSKQTTGNIEYTYDYGGIISASIHPAFLIGPFRIGGYAEMDLADYERVSGGAFDYDSGRFRLVSGGPEIQFQVKEFFAAVKGRFMINATNGATFDMLGDLMGPGAAQGNITGTIGFIF